MSAKRTSMKERYRTLLNEYAEAPDERHLAEAAEIGREMILSGVRIEKIAEFHHEATVDLAKRMPPASFRDQAQRLGVPLIELLMAFSLEFRRNAEAKDRMEAALRNAVREWRRTVDSVDYLILLLDMNGRIIRTNKAAREALKRESGRLSLLPLSALGPGQPWEAMTDLVGRVQQNRSTASLQVQEKSSGRTWDMTATFSSEAKQDDCIVIVARDITEFMGMQESLRRSEVLSKMGSLLGDFAHEVRNPIFSISATIDAFEARFSDQEGVGEYLQVLRGEIDRTSNLMKELLEYGKPSRSELTACHIADVIEDAIRSCRHKAVDAKVAIANHIEGKTPLMRVDRARLSQAFGNILANAIEHSSPGSSVVIDFSETQREGTTWAVCAITDSGPGFGDEDAGRVFEPFFSKRRGGTGLGLSIVRRVVEDHGGHVSAANQAPNGGVVTVELPCRL